ncbi:hypothetical protein [Segeticoccus rhizosphaerae]|uniref:hypothetical protein n=1 Tax=Segeticoccus rhizosphaerae TaxID=1104777 RepID=UPI00126470E3|nr:hypothetical protein [Segeticoccus rhizosphaerae]
MAFNDTALTEDGAALAAAYPYLSLHTTGGVSSSASESTAARQPAGWANSNGDLSAADIAFTGGAASGPVVRVGYWSAQTGGTYGGGCLLTGDQTFNAAGEYTVDSITEPVTSS